MLDNVRAGADRPPLSSPELRPKGAPGRRELLPIAESFASTAPPFPRKVSLKLKIVKIDSDNGRATTSLRAPLRLVNRRAASGFAR